MYAHIYAKSMLSIPNLDISNYHLYQTAKTSVGNPMKMHSATVLIY